MEMGNIATGASLSPTSNFKDCVLTVKSPILPDAITHYVVLAGVSPTYNFSDCVKTIMPPMLPDAVTHSTPISFLRCQYSLFHLSPLRMESQYQRNGYGSNPASLTVSALSIWTDPTRFVTDTSACQSTSLKHCWVVTRPIQKDNHSGYIPTTPFIHAPHLSLWLS